MTTMDVPARSHGLRTIGSVLLAAVLAGGLGVAVAGFGTTALAAVGAVIAGIVLWALVGDLLRPHLAAAVERVRPRRTDRPAPSAARRLVVFGVVTLTAGLLAWGLAAQGLMAAGAVAALLLLAGAGWLLAPLLSELMFAEPADVPQRRRKTAPAGSAADGRTRRLLSGPLGVVLAVGAAGALGVVVAGFGLKGILVTLGLLAAIALLVVVRNRSVFFTFAAVCSLVLVLHKSFSEQDLNNSGGAISVYVTTFDAVIVLLYAIWIFEGTFVADVRAARSQRVLLLPLFGALFLLPSLLVAPSVLLSASELVRMGWMYLLFFYVAVRVRTRAHVWAVLAGLGVFAVIECLVVILQAKTGGVLGLSFLGVPTELGERVTDSASLGRPFGTIIHPVFMGAAMGAVALVALSVALALPRSVPKLAAGTAVGLCLLPLYLAHTRAALVAFAVVAAGVVGWALRRGYLQWRSLGLAALAVPIAVVVLWPQLAAKFEENFSSAHFSEEVASRAELNGIAIEMIGDHPVLGVGLNNFERTMGPYEQYGAIFANNPVHNLYLLVMAETGVIGFVGVVAVGVGLLVTALRLARSRDRLYAGVGIGVTAVMIFFIVEELLGFSLRQDIPLALFWLLAGLAVACSRLASAPEEDTSDARPAPVLTAVGAASTREDRDD